MRADAWDDTWVNIFSIRSSWVVSITQFNYCGVYAMRKRCGSCQYFDYRGPSCHIDPKRMIGMTPGGQAIWTVIPTTKDTVGCKHYEEEDVEADVAGN